MIRNLFSFRGLLMSFLLTATANGAIAANGNELTLIVNGEPMVFVMSEHPVITYTNNTLHIKTDAATTDVPVSEISGGTLPKLVVHGDVNGDFSVDVADISSIIDVMAGVLDPATTRGADVNGDGTVDVADIAATISIMAGE